MHAIIMLHNVLTGIGNRVSLLGSISQGLLQQSPANHAYSWYQCRVVNKWRYLFRTTGQTEGSLQPLEDAIRYKFAPAVTGRPALSENERDIISLPARIGGLDLYNHKE